MRKLIVLLLCMVAAVAACSPAASPTPTPTETAMPAATETAIMTSTADATNTPAPTQTPFIIVVTATVQTPAPTIVNCTPRADWTIQYTVVSGDTLGKIAQRTGTTTSQLAQGNCIADPNRIVVGQKLRVPREPATPTPTSTATATTGVTATATATNGVTSTASATTTATTIATTDATETATSTSTVAPLPTTEPTATSAPSAYNCLESTWTVRGSDFVSISPNAGQVKPGCIQIASGTNATVSWGNAPAGTTEVTFWRLFDENMRGDVIGVDSTPEDGFSVQFTFASIKNGEIYAMVTAGAKGSSDLIGYTITQ